PDPCARTTGHNTARPRQWVLPNEKTTGKPLRTKRAGRSVTTSKGPELVNPLDPGSKATGNARYVLNEIYESPAGIENHWQEGQQSWGDFAAMVEVIGSRNPQTLHGGEIAQSLW